MLHQYLTSKRWFYDPSRSHPLNTTKLGTFRRKDEASPEMQRNLLKIFSMTRGTKANPIVTDNLLEFSTAMIDDTASETATLSRCGNQCCHCGLPMKISMKSIEASRFFTCCHTCLPVCDSCGMAQNFPLTRKLDIQHEIYNVSLTQSDMRRLTFGIYGNDQLCDIGMGMLSREFIDRGTFDGIEFFSTFLLSKYISEADSVKAFGLISRWLTKKSRDLFSMKALIFPFQDSLHFSLFAVVNLRDPVAEKCGTILHLDSISGYHDSEKLANAIRMIMSDHFKATRSSSSESEPGSVFNAVNLPLVSPAVLQQPNGTECLMHMLMNFENFCEQVNLSEAEHVGVQNLISIGDYSLEDVQKMRVRVAGHINRSAKHFDVAKDVSVACGHCKQIANESITKTRQRIAASKVKTEGKGEVSYRSQKSDPLLTKVESFERLLKDASSDSDPLHIIAAFLSLLEYSESLFVGIIERLKDIVHVDKSGVDAARACLKSTEIEFTSTRSFLNIGGKITECLSSTSQLIKSEYRSSLAAYPPINQKLDDAKKCLQILIVGTQQGGEHYKLFKTESSRVLKLVQEAVKSPDLSSSKLPKSSTKLSAMPVTETSASTVKKVKKNIKEEGVEDSKSIEEEPQQKITKRTKRNEEAPHIAPKSNGRVSNENSGKAHMKKEQLDVVADGQISGGKRRRQSKADQVNYFILTRLYFF